MFDILDAVLTILDAVRFWKKTDQEEPHNRKWRMIGALLLLFIGLIALLFSIVLVLNVTT